MEVDKIQNGTLLILERFSDCESRVVWGSLYGPGGDEVRNKTLVDVDGVGRRVKFCFDPSLSSDAEMETVDFSTLRIAVGESIEKAYYFSRADLKELNARSSEEIAAAFDANFGETRTWEQANPSRSWKLPLAALLLVSLAGVAYMNRTSIQAWMNR